VSDLFVRGGWVFVGIVALSFFAWTLIVGTWWRLKSQETGSAPWAERVVKSVRAGDVPAAVEICRERTSLVGRFLFAGLAGREPRLYFADRHVAPVLRGEATALGRFLPQIAVLGSSLPLLGLLGTILGMVETFGAITRHGTQEVGQLADGISQALITTQAGLVAALPVLVLHRYLASRVRRCMEMVQLYGKQVQAAIAHGGRA